MGSKASKVTRVAGTGARKYPSRLPEIPSSQTVTSTQPSPDTGPSVHSKAHASWGRNEAIKQDAQDPDFQSMLRTIGVAQQQQQIPDAAKNIPLNSRSSNSLHTLSRRQILDNQRSNESSATGAKNNRSWADTSTILQIITLRDDKHLSAEQIEKDLRLVPGFVKRLGTKIAKP